RLFHTAVTASGSVYNTWQCRVMYHWFKQARRRAGGADMGGFTRILHSGRPDEFVHEIPTFVADPLPDGADQESLSRIAPTWMNISLAMKKDPEADKAFGWVLEMYAYAVSSALHGVGNILHKDFMIQPPWDLEIGDSFIIHYTYGCDYDMKVYSSLLTQNFRIRLRSSFFNHVLLLTRAN
uniref:Hydroxyproline O-arabinosyltransferase-like domain-containing protein n=1 Tax=Aegilops tauschii subsp. strangulata TaxID=200361 RepID=A0A453QXY2_AEGTS